MKIETKNTKPVYGTYIEVEDNFSDWGEKIKINIKGICNYNWESEAAISLNRDEITELRNHLTKLLEIPQNAC